MNPSSASIALNIATFRARMFESLLGTGSNTGSSFADILSQYQAGSGDPLAALNPIASDHLAGGDGAILSRLVIGVTSEPFKL